MNGSVNFKVINNNDRKYKFEQFTFIRIYRFIGKEAEKNNEAFVRAYMHVQCTRRKRRISSL